MIEDGITIDSPWLDLRRADCMDLMKDFEDNHFDLAIVDPPYGINHSSIAGKQSGQKYGNAAAAKGNYEEKDWDRLPPEPRYFLELMRTSKEQVIWGANHFSSSFSSSSSGWIFWDKDTGANGFSDGELAFTSYQKGLRKFCYTWNGMIQGNMKEKERRIHPTQKPVQLYKWLLTNYAKPGQRILDTHMGSGSIAIACHYFGAHLTACEIDEDYFRSACERIERETRQGTLWEGAMP